MNFKSEKQLKTYLNSLEFIGQGSQGICYLDKTNNIVIYDIMYNILYNNGTFKIIDTLEYSYGDKVKDNMRGFNLEIMLFLVDNYFDDFVNKNSILKEMYLSDSVSCIEFIEALRYALSSYIGTKITRLNEAKKLIRRKEKPIYIRN